MSNKYEPLLNPTVWEGYKTPLSDANLNNIEGRIDEISNYLLRMQETGGVLGKGTIIGDTSKPIDGDTYLSIQDGNINIARFCSSDITLFHNITTEGTIPYVPLLHLHMGDNDSDKSYIAFEGKELALLYTGTSNNSIHQKDSTAGVKGFYWRSIKTNSDGTVTLTLSSKQDEDTLDLNIGSYGWQVGDVITIHNFYWYDSCASIRNVSGNTITVHGLPFTSRLDPKTAGQHLNYAVYVTETLDPELGQNIFISRDGEVSFGHGAFSVGVGNYAIGHGSASFGDNNQSVGHYSFTAGRDNKSHYAGFIGGRQNVAKADYVSGGGYGNTSHADYTHFEGRQNTLKETAACGHVEGYNNTVSGQYAHGEGNGNEASGDAAHAEGMRNKAYAPTSHVGGADNEAQVKASGAFIHGQFLKAVQRLQVVFGTYNATNANALLQVGNGKNGKRSNAFEIGSDGSINAGYSNTVNGTRGFSAGGLNTVTGEHGVALGYNNTSSGNNAIALGYETEASASAAISVGSNTKATSDNAFCEGYECEANGNNSHAGGYKCIANGWDAVAFGNQCKANRNNSFAGGYKSQTNVEGGIAVGAGLDVSSTWTEAAFGKYNKAYNGQRFSIGDGTSETDRKNAFSVGVDFMVQENTNEYYIMVGETKIRESQLISLLQLI